MFVCQGWCHNNPSMPESVMNTVNTFNLSAVNLKKFEKKPEMIYTYGTAGFRMK